MQSTRSPRCSRGHTWLWLFVAATLVAFGTDARASDASNPLDASTAFLNNLLEGSMDAAADGFFVPASYDAARAAEERRGLARALRQLQSEFGPLLSCEPFVGTATTVNVALRSGTIADMASGAIPSSTIQVRCRARFEREPTAYLSIQTASDGGTWRVVSVQYELDATTPGAMGRVQDILRRLSEQAPPPPSRESTSARAPS